MKPLLAIMVPVAFDSIKYEPVSISHRNDCPHVQNRVMEESLDDSISEVIEGSSISAPLKKSGVFPPIITHMISTGEKSGNLEEMLMKAADAYEEDVETSVAGLTSVLEPFMIIVMGIMVGGIVLAILLPMLEMSTIVR